MAYTKELEQKEEVFRVGFYTYSQWAKFYLKCKWLVALMPSVEPGDAAHPPVSRMLPGPCGESQILMQDSQGGSILRVQEQLWGPEDKGDSSQGSGEMSGEPGGRYLEASVPAWYPSV